MKKFVVLAIFVLATAGMANVASVLQTGDIFMSVDSVLIRGASGNRLITTEHFGGAPGIEDTFQFDERTEWPENGIVVYWSDENGPRPEFMIPQVVENQYYEFPLDLTDTPTQIKFINSGAVGEGARTVIPVRLSVAPNPLVTSSVVRLAVRRAGELQVEVCDGTGQVVRVLSSGRAEPGNIVLNWDGADSAGTRVSTGVYFVRAALDGSRSLAKVVVTE